MSKATRNRSWLEVGVAMSAVFALGIGALLVASPTYAGTTDCGEECYYECDLEGSDCVGYYAQGNSITMICESGDISFEMTESGMCEG